MKRILLAALLGALPLVSGCLAQHSVHMEPIRLEPIQVTMDVNVRVQNESAGDELDDVGEADAGAAAETNEDPGPRGD